MDTQCYCAALRVASRKISALYDEALAPAGINVAQFGLLRRIDRAGALSLTELGRLSALDRSTVGRNAKVLQRAALIQPAPGEDGREARMALTSAGERVLEQAMPLWQATQERIEHVLDADTLGELRLLHRRLDDVAPVVSATPASGSQKT